MAVVTVVVRARLAWLWMVWEGLVWLWVVREVVTVETYCNRLQRAATHGWMQVVQKERPPGVWRVRCRCIRHRQTR